MPLLEKGRCMIAMKNTPVSGKRLYTLFEAYNPFGPDLGLSRRKKGRPSWQPTPISPLGLSLQGFSGCRPGRRLAHYNPVQRQRPCQGRKGVAGSREVPYLKALRLGARMGLTVLESYMDAYNPPFVAVALTILPYLTWIRRARMIAMRKRGHILWAGSQPSPC